MSTKSEMSNAGTPTTCTKQEERTDIWSIIWLGLAPLFWLAIIGGAEVALLSLIRQSMNPSSFLLQQQIFLMVMISGLTAAIIAYTITMTRALRRIEMWRRDGHTTKATAGLVVVTAVAIIIVLPVILALFFH